MADHNNDLELDVDVEEVSHSKKEELFDFSRARSNPNSVSQEKRKSVAPRSVVANASPGLGPGEELELAYDPRKQKRPGTRYSSGIGLTLSYILAAVILGWVVARRLGFVGFP